MTRLVIEQGPMAPSLVASVHGGKPAMAASVRAFNQCGQWRCGLELRGISQARLSREDHGHLSPLAGAFYSAPANPSLDVALG